jgi:predicted RNA-binding Zn-ribbon protein involved in translation (DUF1610 family)
MKLVTQKIYCPACGKLVRAREQKSGSESLVLCTQCGRQLHSWNGLRWKSGPADPTKQGEPESPVQVGTRRPAPNRKAN